MPGNIPYPSPSVVESWPTPNYVDPERRTWLPPYAIGLQSTASFFAILRWVLRFSEHGGGLGLDDAVLFPGWLLSMAFTVVAVVGANQGLIDRHIWDLKPTQHSQIALNAWIAEFVFLLGTACVKVSILLFYRRLVQGTITSKWRLAIWGAISFTTVWTSGLLIALVFNCVPTRAYWMAYDMSWQHKYHCTNTKWINPLTGILGAVSDLYAVALPWLLLRPLQMAPRQKLQLHLLFGCGIIVAAISAGRTWAMVKLGTDYDLTWVAFEVYVFSLMEYELGILVACLPALRALLKLLSERARLRGSEGNVDDDQAVGSSPDLEPATWRGDQRLMNGCRKQEVVIGGHSKD